MPDSANIAGRKFIAGRADEACDIGIGREVEHLHWCRQLRGSALMQDQQAVAKRHRLDLIVGHVKACDAQPPLQAANFRARPHPQGGVQVGKRLIEQEQLWLTHDGPTHRDALALTA